MPRDRRRQEDSDLQERVLFIHRVSKTVKGGRRMSLLALVAVGDGKGKIGLGLGKSAEVPQAIAKAVEDAKKQMFKVAVTDEGTVPHEVEGHFGAGDVLIKPAIEGTGVIAGGPIRPIFELAGVTNVLSKSLGTTNPLNMAKAAAVALQQLELPEQTAERRGITVSEMFAGKEN
ncbi:MAG: 30S ribosomal protein S5 [Coriobacteriaceae bacterium]|jgi:small subunit ribosomal protein S5|uniref:30S ribosomal protein S5 n=1 Tax=Atopobium sp. oral taxon 416 TaxID=712157 RepID=UPI000FF21EFE|nr:30S ribosomal protein S5 [Atopobium sp. oral taxon 416]QUC03793.1 30S ribosomal protein S5 [Atopobium sp. oral taxon 416]RRF99371.1 MAG: 30S ribosomal protein S5 [Coriobacteriaceae bacterium]